MTQTLQNRSHVATSDKKSGALPHQNYDARMPIKRRAVLANALGAGSSAAIGVVHGQQGYSCIIFGLFHRRNKTRTARNMRFDVTLESA